MRFLDAVFVFQMHEREQLLWHQRVHAHGASQCEVHYFVDGSGTFTNARRRYQIRPGSLFVTSQETVHAIEANEDDPLTYYAILFAWEEGAELIASLQEKHPFVIGTNWRFFFEEIRDKGLQPNLQLQLSATHQLLSLLYALAANTNVTEQWRGDHRLEKAIHYMQEHLFCPITLEEVATHVGLNRSYFARLFKTKMNTTPMRYYNALRMEAARAFLTSTDLSIKEIAEKLQFCSEFHFSKRFKETSGQSPSSYRNTHLQRIGSR